MMDKRAAGQAGSRNRYEHAPMDVLPAYPPVLIADILGVRDRRVLLFGESGVGKSTLAEALAREYAAAGRLCRCIGADPGFPAFGPPGAVSLGRWNDDGWRLLELEALCTLDAGRFRLPLVSAVRRLAEQVRQDMLLVDAPGIVRSVAGAELLAGLAEAAAIDTVLVLVREGRQAPLANELATLGCATHFLRASEKARLPRKRQRVMQRTRMWEAYLGPAGDRNITVPTKRLTGTPPPLEAEREWPGRQAAFLAGGRTLALGEILDFSRQTFRIRAADFQDTPDQILVRDARRDSAGLLATFRKTCAGSLIRPQPDVAPWSAGGINSGPVPVARIGEATAVLINGVFGDPLLHLRLHNRKRSILFDLGEGGRLPARLAHQVSDVFISHAHIDHICGFLWLLRSRIGVRRSCRLFGPPGLSDRIAGLMNGILWDRIGGEGPRFEVGEVHADRLLVYGLQAGLVGKKQIGERRAEKALLPDDPDCRVRAVTLDHGGIPVLAYRLEQGPKYNVRREHLARRGWTPGPWLGELKKRIAAGDRTTMIRLPDGSTCTTGTLADELLLITPAQKLVYATDLSDTVANRGKLTGLARKAHTFFCEAAFTTADRRYAELGGHLTAAACGEIARNAGVGRLAPFHFSRRYEKRPEQIYDEIGQYCGGIAVIGPGG